MRQKTNDRSRRYDAAKKSTIFDGALRWCIVVPKANRAFATHPIARFGIKHFLSFFILLSMNWVWPLPMSAQIEIQGHRGWRGQYPENTIEGFLQALQLGVDVLELDVVVSGDGKVVVSHEPWMNPAICLDPNGNPLSKGSRRNIYKMTLAEIQAFDCGSAGNPRFPGQQAMPAVKPELNAAIRAAEAWAEEHYKPPVLYNIEIKRRKSWDGRYTPPYKQFADLVVEEIRRAGIASRCVIQSFDRDVLEHLNLTAPDIPLAYLVEKGRIQKNLKRLAFTPDIYSPLYTLLDLEQMQSARDKGIAVIPWTVNDPESIRRIAALGVDGIISDYPDRVMDILKRR
jgi:glycerophosphoryl diester phosphodiesterase